MHVRTFISCVVQPLQFKYISIPGIIFIFIKTKVYSCRMALLLMMLGACLLLLIEIIVLKYWLSKADPVRVPLGINEKEESGDSDSLKALLDQLSKSFIESSGKIGTETACTLNVLMAFLFQEMRHESKTRATVISKINSEIADIMASKLNSKLLKSLKLHNFSLGTCPPTFDNISVCKLKLSDNASDIKKLHLSADVVYKGGGKLAMLATTVFGKNLYISIEVERLIGKMIFILSRYPHTHWGFCFDNEPELKLNVISSFQQKNLPWQISRFLTSAIKTSIARKHTKPNYKKRYAPFFKEPALTPGPDSLFFLNNKPIHEGILIVKLISANRVVSMATKPAKLFCTVSTCKKLWDTDCCPVKQNISFDTVISNINSEIGISFRNDTEAENGVFVGDVVKNSPAQGHLKPGDFITAINNKRISNLRSALAASLSVSGKARVSVSRPIVKDDKLLTSGDAFQDMILFDKESGMVKDASFVEEEEFLVFKNFLETEYDGGDSEASSDNIECNVSCVNNNEKVLRSGSCTSTITPFWDEYFLLDIKDYHRYVSIGLWKEEEDGNSYLLGYQNICIADVVLNCMATNSNSYSDAVFLSPPRSNKWQEDSPLQQPLSSIPSLAQKLRLIAGEVRLQFSFLCKDKVREPCLHVFVNAHVPEQPCCASCRIKICHNSAFICLSCAMVIHKKCLSSITPGTPKKMATVRTPTEPRNLRLGSASGGRVNRRANLIRRRSRTMDSKQPNTKMLPSFFFLRGSEKRTAIVEERIAKLNESLEIFKDLRSHLLRTKAQCLVGHIPESISEQLVDIEGKIDDLESQKEKLASLIATS